MGIEDKAYVSVEASHMVSDTLKRNALINAMLSGKVDFIQLKRSREDNMVSHYILPLQSNEDFYRQHHDLSGEQELGAEKAMMFFNMRVQENTFRRQSVVDLHVFHPGSKRASPDDPSFILISADHANTFGIESKYFDNLKMASPAVHNGTEVSVDTLYEVPQAVLESVQTVSDRVAVTGESEVVNMQGDGTFIAVLTEADAAALNRLLDRGVPLEQIANGLDAMQPDS